MSDEPAKPRVTIYRIENLDFIRSDRTFEATVSAFTPDVVRSQGWPMFPYSELHGGRVAINPAHVTDIVELP